MTIKEYLKQHFIVTDETVHASMTKIGSTIVAISGIVITLVQLGAISLPHWVTVAAFVIGIYGGKTTIDGFRNAVKK